MQRFHKTYTVSEATEKLRSFCAYQERCHKEVEEKLKGMQMIEVARQEIIHTLLKENFLNEERYARSFVRGKFKIKKWGKIRLKRELKLRDISAFNIKAGLEEINEAEYNSTFHGLAEKKWNNLRETSILKKKKKLTDYLFYRGWESHLIYEKINQLASE